MGKRISKFRYIVLNKPFGVISSFTNAMGKPTLAQYISVSNVYPIGRLDYDSEGLLLLTDDGLLSHQVADPRGKIWKSYLAQVERTPNSSTLNQLRRGIVIRNQRTRPATVSILESEPILWPRSTPIRYRKTVPTSWLLIKIHEGRNRQIRRMTAAVGFPTLRLIRIAIGPIHRHNLQPGEWRDLDEIEVMALREACGDRENRRGLSIM